MEKFTTDKMFANIVGSQTILETLKEMLYIGMRMNQNSLHEETFVGIEMPDNMDEVPADIYSALLAKYMLILMSMNIYAQVGQESASNILKQDYTDNMVVAFAALPINYIVVYIFMQLMVGSGVSDKFNLTKDFFNIRSTHE